MMLSQSSISQHLHMVDAIAVDYLLLFLGQHNQWDSQAA